MQSFCALGNALLHIKVNVTTKIEIWKYFSKLSAQYSEAIITFEQEANDGSFVEWIDEVVKLLCAGINFKWDEFGIQVTWSDIFLLTERISESQYTRYNVRRKRALKFGLVAYTAPFRQFL